MSFRKKFNNKSPFRMMFPTRQMLESHENTFDRMREKEEQLRDEKSSASLTRLQKTNTNLPEIG